MDDQNGTISDKLERIKKFLSDYNYKVGLGNLVTNNEVNRYIVMTQNEIKNLSALECGEASVLLCQEAVFIQNEINKHQAISSWCERSITKLIASTIDNVGNKYTPFEYRKELAIKQHEVASQLDMVMRQEKLRVDAMLFLTNSLRNLSYAFDQLQQTKRGMKI